MTETLWTSREKHMWNSKDGSVGAIGADGSGIAKRRRLRYVRLFLVTIIASLKTKKPLSGRTLADVSKLIRHFKFKRATKLYRDKSKRFRH